VEARGAEASEEVGTADSKVADMMEGAGQAVAELAAVEQGGEAKVEEVLVVEVLEVAVQEAVVRAVAAQVAVEQVAVVRVAEAMVVEVARVGAAPVAAAMAARTAGSAESAAARTTDDCSHCPAEASTGSERGTACRCPCSCSPRRPPDRRWCGCTWTRCHRAASPATLRRHSHCLPAAQTSPRDRAAPRGRQSRCR
jgi:hypothetical protein